jgi:hypothetical protein
MPKTLTIFIERGKRASFTAAIQNSGLYYQLDNPGGTLYEPLTIVAGNSYTLGPFPEPRSYCFSYDGPDLSITIADPTDVVSFTPRLICLTTEGVGTYQRQLGYYQVVNKMCFYNVELTWSAHTGSGNMAIGGFPFKARLGSIQRVFFYPNNISTQSSTAADFLRFDSTATYGSLFSGTSVGESSAGVDTAGLLTAQGFYFID